MPLRIIVVLDLRASLSGLSITHHTAPLLSAQYLCGACPRACQRNVYASIRRRRISAGTISVKPQTAKPSAMHQTGGFALSPYVPRGHPASFGRPTDNAGAVLPRSDQRESIHPRVVAFDPTFWVKSARITPAYSINSCARAPAAWRCLPRSAPLIRSWKNRRTRSPMWTLRLPCPATRLNRLGATRSGHDSWPSRNPWRWPPIEFVIVF